MAECLELVRQGLVAATSVRGRGVLGDLIDRVNLGGRLDPSPAIVSLTNKRFPLKAGHQQPRLLETMTSATECPIGSQ
jgi:hypothetical protein